MGVGFFSTKEAASFTATDLETFYQAKHHDQAPQDGFGPAQCHVSLRSMNSVQKRSIKRAFNKAAEYGCAWYRGRCLQLDDFPRVKAPRYRMQIVHLNVGGLSADRLAEIKQWALMTEQDALVLTETRWSFSTEWEDTDWMHLHTGTSTDRVDGILFFSWSIRKCATAASLALPSYDQDDLPTSDFIFTKDQWI